MFRRSACWSIPLELNNSFMRLRDEANRMADVGLKVQKTDPSLWIPLSGTLLFREFLHPSADGQRGSQGLTRVAGEYSKPTALTSSSSSSGALHFPTNTSFSKASSSCGLGKANGEGGRPRGGFSGGCGVSNSIAKAALARRTSRTERLKKLAESMGVPSPTTEEEPMRRMAIHLLHSSLPSAAPILDFTPSAGDVLITHYPFLLSTSVMDSQQRRLIAPAVQQQGQRLGSTIAQLLSSSSSSAVGGGGGGCFDISVRTLHSGRHLLLAASRGEKDTDLDAQSVWAPIMGIPAMVGTLSSSSTLSVPSSSSFVAYSDVTMALSLFTFLAEVLGERALFAAKYHAEVKRCLPPPPQAGCAVTGGGGGCAGDDDALRDRIAKLKAFAAKMPTLQNKSDSFIEDIARAGNGVGNSKAGSGDMIGDRKAPTPPPPAMLLLPNNAACKAFMFGDVVERSQTSYRMF